MTSCHADIRTGIDADSVLENAKKVHSCGMKNTPWCIAGDFNYLMEGLESNLLETISLKKISYKIKYQNFLMEYALEDLMHTVMGIIAPNMT